MIIWDKIGRAVTLEGTTVFYQATQYISNKVIQADVTIESRKRHIPHSNRGGTWDHTSYFVIQGGKELIEKQTLKAAKAYAEELIANGDHHCQRA